MPGQLNSGGCHGNRFGYMIYFSTNADIRSCNLSITIQGKEYSLAFNCYHGNKAENFHILKICTDLLT